MTDYLTKFNSPSDDETKELRTVLDALFKNGSIFKLKFSPETMKEKNNPLYDTCSKWEDYLHGYLEVLGLSLRQSREYEIYYIDTDEKKGASLPKEETFVLLLLRMLYDEKMSNVSFGRIFTTKEELRKKGMDTGLFTEKIPQATWNTILGNLKRKNIISFAGRVSEITDETPLYITEMIMIVINGRNLTRLTEGVLEDGKEYSKQDEAEA